MYVKKEKVVSLVLALVGAVVVGLVVACVVGLVMAFVAAERVEKVNSVKRNLVKTITKCGN